jgi:uncharacterized protein YaeQ
VAVYIHKDSAQFLSRLAGSKIHRVEELEIHAIDRRLVAALVARLDRRMSFSLAVTDRELYVSIETDTITGPVERLRL